MAARWANPSEFRADPTAMPAPHPSRRQTFALIGVLAFVAGAVAAVSYFIRPDKARAFDLFHGSLFLSDQNSPVAVDLATGKPTLRLLGADKQVGIDRGQPMAVVPLTDRTLLLNEATGEFNMVDNSGFVVKRDGGGVPLDARSGPSSSFGVPARAGEAYIVRTGPAGTDVYLVSQPTVESAIGASAGVQPRASGSMSAVVSPTSGSAVSANGDLWVLAGPTASSDLRTVRRLRVPAGSSPGATLVPTTGVQVNGPAAVGAATTGRDGSGAQVVAAASSSRLDLYGPGTRHTVAPFAVPGGVREILPTSGGQGRLSFLMHATAGWYLVSIDADGGNLRVPTLLDGVPAGAVLAAPAASNGRLYTIDKASGALYVIGADGSAQRLGGRGSYPLATLGAHVVEAPDFADAYVVSRGPRVVVNSPDHADALMIFTDGSHAPRTIPKSAAVTVSAAGGAEALTRIGVSVGRRGRHQPPGQPKPKPEDAQPINTKIDCKTANQKPHIPVITSAVPGSRTVALAWSYPVISVQDCYPSTYLVSTKLVNSGAPQPPGPVQVQSQTGTNLSGLFPSTQYEVTVTAFINGQSTASLPVRVATGPEGPKAPTDLTVVADAAGNWRLTWDSCGTVASGCVPAQTWTISASYCDGRGLAAPPPSITVTADPTSTHQPPATYPGSDALLGRGLAFEVQGTGPEGEAGAPTATSRCVYSWTPPVGADMSVQASTPPQTAGSQDRTATTVTVSFAKGQVHDLGGVGGTLTYELLDASGVVNRVGPTRQPSVRLRGIRAAQRYQVRVLATPPRHPEATIPLGPVDVVPAIAAWPHVRLDPPDFSAPPGLTGTLHLSFTFPTGTDFRGETFDLIDSRLSCGNTALDLQRADVLPGQDLQFAIDRRTYNGACTVTLQLVQDARTMTDPPLYGAAASAPADSAAFQIDPPSITSIAGDFDAQWGGSTGQPTVVVTYHGGDDLSGASNWRVSLTNGSAQCGQQNGNPPPLSIDVDKQCIRDGGTFTVDIDYVYFGAANAHFEVPVTGQAPTPVDPAKIDFSARWNADATRPQALAEYTGSEPASALESLDWTETVTSSITGGVPCGTGTANPGDGTIRVDVDLALCPPTGSGGAVAVYTITISFTDPNYGLSGDYPRVVQGTPPQ